jgi:IS1 family transposase
MKCGVFTAIKSIKSGSGGLQTARTGETIAFRFGTREHENLDRLLELLNPLNTGNVYTDGNYSTSTQKISIQNLWLSC